MIKFNKNTGKQCASLFLYLGIIALSGCNLIQGIKKPDLPPAPSPRPVYPDLSGGWHKTSYYDKGFLIIETISDSSFHFILQTARGSHTGYMDTLAFWQGDTAYFFLKEEQAKCTLKFSKRYDTIVVNEPAGNCFAFHGNQTIFSGKYVKNKPLPPNLVSLKIVRTSVQDSVFKLMTGKYYHTFIDYADRITKEEIANFNKFHCFVTGMMGYMEAVLMIEGETMFAGILIPEEDESIIHIFTNSSQPFPAALVEWTEIFDVPVITH